MHRFEGLCKNPQLAALQPLAEPILAVKCTNTG